MLSERSDSSDDGGDASGDDLNEMMYAISGAAGIDSDAEDDEVVGDWNIIKEYETSIEVDSVDTHLLEVAHSEVPIVLNRLKVKMFGASR